MNKTNNYTLNNTNTMNSNSGINNTLFSNTARERETPTLFTIDKKDLLDYSLPKKLETATILPKDRRNDKNKKSKALEFTKDTSTIVEPYAFLPNALGRPKAKPVDGVTNDLDNSHMNSDLKLTKTNVSSTKNAQTSDVDEVSVIMAGIQTSDDAINFFARYGSETPVKFVHLQQLNNSKVFSPYDLTVVNHLVDPNAEHYTMSSAGIVHVAPGEPSDCTPLSAWMRQGMMFKIIRNIPFYKFFLHRKMFTAWKENVRFLLFTKQRKKLTDRLFYARKSSSSSILSVKKCLLEIQNVQLLNLDLKTCDKDVFIDQQTTQGMKANGKFDEAMRLVVAEVQSVIVEVNNMHSMARQEPNAHNGFSDTEKAKSLVKIKQEKAEKKILRQRAKLEFNTLPEFIRFIDYMSVQTLVALAVNTTHSFYDELVKPRKAGIFETMVRFSDSGTSFSPTCQEVREMLDKLLENMINAVGNVNRVSYLNNKANNNAGPNIQAIVRENKQFRSIADHIQQRVVSDFDKAIEHAQSYESIRPIYDFNVAWDFEAYRAQQHDMASLKGMMELISNWSKELEKLRNKPVGVLEVDSRRLKGELNPLREARLQEIKEYIKDIAR